MYEWELILLFRLVDKSALNTAWSLRLRTVYHSHWIYTRKVTRYFLDSMSWLYCQFAPTPIFNSAIQSYINCCTDSLDRWHNSIYNLDAERWHALLHVVESKGACTPTPKSWRSHTRIGFKKVFGAGTAQHQSPLTESRVRFEFDCDQTNPQSCWLLYNHTTVFHRRWRNDNNCPKKLPPKTNCSLNQLLMNHNL